MRWYCGFNLHFLMIFDEQFSYVIDHLYIYAFFNIYSDSFLFSISLFRIWVFAVCLVFCLCWVFFYILLFSIEFCGPLYSLDVTSLQIHGLQFFSPFHRLPFHSVAHWLFPLLCRSLLVWHNPICFLLLLLPRPTQDA